MTPEEKIEAIKSVRDWNLKLVQEYKNIGSESMVNVCQKAAEDAGQTMLWLEELKEYRSIVCLYMAVTPDEYELPLYVSDTAAELARHYGLKPNTVSTSISQNKNGEKTGRKFVKVIYD